MKLQSIQKMGGISIIAGSLLLTLWCILYITLLPVSKITTDFSQLVSDSHWILVLSIVFVAMVLMVFGFTAVYSKMYNRAGVTGFIGYIFITLAYIIQTALTTWELFLYPLIVSDERTVFLIRDKVILFSTSFVIFHKLLEVSLFIGVLFFCLSLIRNKIFPAISGYCIFLGSIIYAISAFVGVYIEITGIIILSIGFCILGYKLISTSSSKLQGDTNN